MAGTPARGRFITLEGGEGSGKSTQARLLAEALTRAGRDTLLTREPGGAPAAEEIRALLVQGHIGRWDPLSEALLHYAARREHLTATIRPALAAGSWVVCDRFADSTLAYQGFGLGVDRGLIALLYERVVEDTAPDLTLILDLPVDEGLRRAGGRARLGGASGEAGAGAETRYERMDPAFHRRLRDGYLEIARADPRRCVAIDARPAVESVQAAIRAALRERLGVAPA
ncbi:MAG: dTMP kinase [Dongiaceae bacterium]